MKDIQNLTDNRNINIKKVGVKTVSYPITLRDKLQRQQHTIATANMYVNLPHQFKGTHMSRFVEILNAFHGDFNIRDFPEILKLMKERLNAEASHLELSFPYFMSCGKGETLLKKYSCTLHGTLQKRTDFLLKIEVPISISAHSSNEMSEKRPTSQIWAGHWGTAEIAVKFHRFFWLEDIIGSVENALCTEYGRLMHEKLYKLTAEGVSRAIGKQLDAIEQLKWFSATVYNDINVCSTFARVEGGNIPL